MHRKNSTWGCSGQEGGVQQSCTTVDAGIIEIGLWRHQYIGIAREECLSREIINRCMYYGCHGGWDMGILCHIDPTVDVHLLQKYSQTKLIIESG